MVREEENEKENADLFSNNYILIIFAKKTAKSLNKQNL